MSQTPKITYEKGECTYLWVFENENIRFFLKVRLFNWSNDRSLNERKKYFLKDDDF